MITTNDSLLSNNLSKTHEVLAHKATRLDRQNAQLRAENDTKQTVIYELTQKLAQKQVTLDHAKQAMWDTDTLLKYLRLELAEMREALKDLLFSVKHTNSVLSGNTLNRCDDAAAVLARHPEKKT